MFKNFFFKGLLVVLFLSTTSNSAVTCEQSPSTTGATLEIGKQKDWFKEIVKSFEAAKTKNGLDNSLELPGSARSPWKWMVIWSSIILLTTVINSFLIQKHDTKKIVPTIIRIFSLRCLFQMFTKDALKVDFFSFFLRLAVVFYVIKKSCPGITSEDKANAKREFYSEFSVKLAKILEPLKDMQMLEANQPVLPELESFKRCHPKKICCHPVVIIPDTKRALLQNMVSSLSKYDPSVREEILRSTVFAKTVATLLSQPGFGVLHYPCHEPKPATVVANPAPEATPAPIIAQETSPEASDQSATSTEASVAPVASDSSTTAQETPDAQLPTEAGATSAT